MNALRFLLLIGSCALFSCSQKNDFFFPEKKNGLNIWLGSATIREDSVTYNFAYTLAGRDSVMFNYRMSGHPLQQDTEFELEAVSGDTALVPYSFGKYVLKAGTFQGRFPIYIDKPDGYKEFENTTGSIVFRLKPSPVLEEGAKEISGLKLRFRNFVSKPDNWDVATSPYFTMARYFGAYSNRKYSFIIQTTGMANFKIYYTVSNNPVLEENTITATQATYLQNKCKVALQAYVAQHGQLMDENNNPVVFP
ncbi:DUF4843 domain-containing protein [Parasegetibacter sp. NRK P23]|uniref:DUF4843 domain-containing protein n=1 Tax=Parasegetibacter sp. NRK P23 TaxID=2942999 RepID=UPI002042BF25|nr:DUF4843 domain-containing protein [Parasegetibacter sp. NRK P23]MCM5529214.1 DUF4843 domain-containing protein [Parasegetibacter sp. NRK P23]